MKISPFRDFFFFRYLYSRKLFQQDLQQVSLSYTRDSLPAVPSASVIFGVRSLVLLAVSILMLSDASFQKAPLCIVTQAFYSI